MADGDDPVRAAKQPSRRRVLWLGSGGALLGGSSVLTALAAGGVPDADAADAVQAGGATIELRFDDGFDAPLRALARDWVRRSAAAVSGYFGRFPVPQVQLRIRAVDGSGVRGGTALADPQLHIRLRVGRDTTPARFLDDWILVHEMIHLAIPQVPRTQNWLPEGIAVYVEGVARGRAGLVAPATVWREWARDMPKGQPRPGDAGLDHTPTWGRTYWGGAIFCLLADVRICQRSGDRLGLPLALQGVIAAGGSHAVAWPLTRILATADAAVGQDTLMALYERMKDSPAPVDLVELWRRLGVDGDHLDDAAPLSVVRRAILS